jgi:hypothetical protein
VGSAVAPRVELDVVTGAGFEVDTGAGFDLATNVDFGVVTGEATGAGTDAGTPATFTNSSNMRRKLSGSTIC